MTLATSLGARAQSASITRDVLGHPSQRPGHVVQFYNDEQTLSLVVGDFLAAGLLAGEPVVVVAALERHTMFLEQLTARGIDTAAELERRRLVLLDAKATLASLMVDGMPDAEAFRLHLGSLVAELAAGDPQRRVRAYGEMVDVLWKSDQRQAALALEALWDELVKANHFTLLCAYSMRNFSRESDTAPLRLVCQQHAFVLPVENDAQTDHGQVELLKQVALMQQRALALETELNGRKHLESALRVALGERHRQEEQLRASRRELHEFLENAVEGIHWVGPDGVIQWVNQAELAMLGYSHSEYVGHHIAEFHVDNTLITDLLERLRRFETVRNQEAQLRAKDGSIKHVSISTNVYQRDGEFIHTRCFTRDITQRKLDEERLRFQAAILQHVHDSVIVSDLNGVILHWSRGAASLFGFTEAQAIGQTLALVGRALEPAPGKSAVVEWRGTRSDGQVVWVEESSSELLDSRGQVIGRIALGKDITEKKRIAERSEALQAVTAALSQAFSAREVATVAVEQGVRALGAGTCGLWTVSPDGSVASLMAESGYTPEAQAQYATLDLQSDFPAAVAMRSHQPIWVESISEFKRGFSKVEQTFKHPLPDYGFVCLPLMVEQRCIGAMAFRFLPNHNLREDERVLFVVLARHCALALERAQLFEQAQKARMRSAFLAEASELLGTSLDAEKTLEALAHLSVPMLGDWCTIDMLTAERQVQRLALVHQDPERVALAREYDQKYPLDLAARRGPGKVLRTGESDIIPEIPDEMLAQAIKDPERLRMTLALGIKSCLSVALMIRGEVIGAMTVGYAASGRRYDTSDLRLAEDLARHASIAVDNARLYREATAR